MAYLRHNRVSRKIRGTFGPEFELNELYAGPAWRASEKEPEPSAWYDGFMVKKLLRQQRNHGSWGGYTVSTLFSVAALDHFCRKHPARFPTIPRAIHRGLRFVDPLYFDHGKGNYLGCLMDGGVWDTILAAQALAQAGETSDPLILADENLYETQTAQGGFPYGLDFEQYPDVDDTSRALVFLEKMARFTRRTGAAASRKKGLQLASDLNLIADHGAVFAVYSPENQPIAHHLAKIVEKIEGLPFLPGAHERMSPTNVTHAMEFLFPHLYMIDSPTNMTVDEIITKTEALVLQKGITHLVIDPWNELDHARESGQTETDYISLAISRLKQFGRRRGVHVFVVAHPTKLQRDPDGNYPVPTPYDVAGSAHWRNKSDNCITVWRNTSGDIHYSEIHVTKVRWKQNGHIGICAFQWNPICGQYAPTECRRTS